jgi:hypothetical protein
MINLILSVKMNLKENLWNLLIENKKIIYLFFFEIYIFVLFIHQSIPIQYFSQYTYQIRLPYKTYQLFSQRNKIIHSLSFIFYSTHGLPTIQRPIHLNKIIYRWKILHIILEIIYQTILVYSFSYPTICLMVSFWWNFLDIWGG